MKQDRETVLAKMRARARRLREADPDAFRAKQRQRYAEKGDRIRHLNAQSYARHRDQRLAIVKAYREADPQRADLQLAKRLLMRETGVRVRDIPDELAAVKVMELHIKRELRGVDA